MGRLLLMRHGKAAWPDGIEDVERPLADRGRREAALAGDWIREHVGTVDAVLCSSARRTRETFAATGIDAPVAYLDQLYEAWTGDLLAAVNQVDPLVQTVLLVGHAPGTPGLAARLADGASDPDLVNQIRAGFPTSAIAVLDADLPWAELDAESATLVDVVIPR
ncbi:phosphohistidine phosphatase [Aeromicrobium flavum]|uniref:Phosphohistidine phosphatase n=1 Tax=Aeromicrobium flavum TaxID=416568 RepID=A0A512HXL7_9ACTN|nr:histidine phosphatase family protein [Aeromicrobium flavum]GEO90193.1 phosphohistidine phosphatase [Aeromicrobium flavum]